MDYCMKQILFILSKPLYLSRTENITTGEWFLHNLFFDIIHIKHRLLVYLCQYE